MLNFTSAETCVPIPIEIRGQTAPDVVLFARYSMFLFQGDMISASLSSYIVCFVTPWGAQAIFELWL